MKKEIERKYLVKNDSYKYDSESLIFRQGYLSIEPKKTVRVRNDGNKGFITIKGERKGTCRLEYQYEIPGQDAKELLENLCEKPLIEKIRYFKNYEGFLWEVDEFFGENEGLIIAEIELESEDTVFPIPDWIGEEVTEDNRYYNSNLVKNPYKSWNK